MLKFIKMRFKALSYAWCGLIDLFKNEAAFQAQSFIAVFIICAGFYFDISRWEWSIQILTIALVMGLEAINSSIEEMADFIHPDFHDKIGKVKDLAAGAVILAGIFAVIVTVIIYGPYLFSQ